MVVALWYHYVAVARLVHSYHMCVNLQLYLTCACKCMYVRILSSVTFNCPPFVSPTVHFTGQQWLIVNAIVMCNVCVCVCTYSVFASIRNVHCKLVGYMYKGLPSSFPHLCASSSLLHCGESISEGRFPKCVWVSVCQLGADP